MGSEPTRSGKRRMQRLLQNAIVFNRLVAVAARVTCDRASAAHLAVDELRSSLLAPVAFVSRI